MIATGIPTENGTVVIVVVCLVVVVVVIIAVVVVVVVVVIVVVPSPSALLVHTVSLFITGRFLNRFVSVRAM
jgi:hypothetical protein